MQFATTRNGCETHARFCPKKFSLRASLYYRVESVWVQSKVDFVHLNRHCPVDLRSGPHCIENLEYEHMRGRKGPPRRVFWNVIALSTLSLSLSFLSSFSLSSHFLASRKQNFCTRKCRRRQNITPRSAASSPIFPFERKSLFAFCNLPLSFPFGPHMPLSCPVSTPMFRFSLPPSHHNREAACF